MRRPDRPLRPLLAAVVAGFGLAASALAADPQPHRYAAPIEIVRPAPFVAMPVTPDAYAHAAQGGLRDLRIVDQRGERVPFALLAPPVAASESERSREATLYPLPARPVGGASTWPSPVEVTVQGDRISVRRSARAAATSLPVRESPGWLIDLGERATTEPAPRRLQLRWSGPAEFTAAYAIETSAELRDWQRAGGGQVMALQSAGGTLSQAVVPLPSGSGRFVRLTWLDRDAAPAVTGAASFAPAPGMAAREAAAVELTFAPSAVAAGPGEPKGALQVDLGGELPLVDLDLRFASGTRVAPVRILGRSRASDAWRELASGVLYRIERDGAGSESPALGVDASARFLRIVPDERAAALDPAQVKVVVHARLATLVFAAAGEAPFRLLAGSIDAPAGALPAATLVPRLDEERARFGTARVGAFLEAPEVAAAADKAERDARLRPWLLWSVLLVGVAGLGLVVWRLAAISGRPPAA